MDKRAELLEDDDEEETGNFELRQFYIRNLPSLMRIPLYDISAEVIHVIAVQVHQHEDYPQRWREYISSLGIRNTSALDDIEQTAKVKQQMAMAYALKSPYCHDKSFGHLIKIFLEKQLHILRLIHDDVSDILEKSCTTRVKRLVSIEEQSFGTSTKEAESAASSRDLNNLYISNNSCTASGISCIQDIHNAGHRSCDFGHMQNSTSNKMQIQGTSGGIKEVRLEVLITIPGEERSSENSFSSTSVKRLESDEEKSCCTTAKESSTDEIDSNSLKMSNSCAKSDITSVQSVHKAEHTKFEFDSLQSCSNSGNTIQMKVQGALGGKELSLAVCPSAPIEESLIVLIQHTQFERPLAEKLSTILREDGIIVKMLSDIEHIIMMDAMTALSAIFEEVDFIVPVVSVNFLEEIRPINSARYREAQDSINNYTLYKLYENEFVINRCVNFRVKPVLLPDFNKNLVIKNLIFSKSLRLWTEVPKLIRVLRKTRQIIQNFPHH